MRSLVKNSALTFGILAGLTVILIVLACLQYRWTGGVSEADRERMHRQIVAAGDEFQREFYFKLFRACMVFRSERVDGALTSAGQYADRYERWVRTSTHPHLIANVFVWRAGKNKLGELVRLDPMSRQFVPADPPPAPLERLRTRLVVEPPPPDGKERDRRKPFPDSPPGPEPQVAENDPFAWTMQMDVPALVRPVMGPGPGKDEGRFLGPGPYGYLILQLDSEFLQKEFLPYLVRRSFGGPLGLAYQIAVISREEPPILLYSSTASGSAREFLRGDLVVDLGAGGPGMPFSFPLWQASHGGDEAVTGRSPSGESGHEAGETPGRRRFGRLLLVIRESSQGPLWQLVVKHKAGSLDAAVASLRRRNLAVSFGILLLLAASMVMLFVSTEHARRMAKLQIRFVAGVSHELRTPLTVICSAADNLSAGIVDSKEMVRKYGFLIRSQGRRLADMIQQTLLFASTQTGRRNCTLRPTNIAELVQSTLAEVAPMLESACATIETRIPADLPQVLADREGLSHCIENLVSNAVKYGGGKRWMSLCAKVTGDGQEPEVLITVEDRGAGIDPSELDHIFEPFYRGKAAGDGQIHGTGLGLALAKSLIEEMGGHLSVASVPGEGSAFTLHLPVVSRTGSAASLASGGEGLNVRPV